ncbi:T9SS type A sorting domain-containing protein [Cochleicola gelatinilyticus]|uniref:HYR domain-containing protein n=1 Tax=Cochleicola gelatinilyticus TaxID=1763537 RepID=A0A167IGJ0_9FLAO|nr:T9SS type A sorting domain-containing protein [Cochleicola gelatinilyticus]OAB79630.1 hypothetical protein ULVI_02420 [Cochleicola gelatinilyticus]
MVKFVLRFLYFWKPILLVTFLLISTPILSQCPEESVYLNTQAKINQFVALYPNCTQIQAPYLLSIGHPNGNTNITDLSPLSQITSVSGHIEVFGNPNLTSLDGLQNMVFQPNSGLTIVNNIQLTSLQDAGSLASTNFSLSISNLPLLSDFSSLPNFSVLKSFSLYQTDSFSDLSGLENITSITGGISISENSGLTNLNGLQVDLSESPNNSRITIINNPILQTISGLLNSATGTFSIIVINNPNLNSLSGLEPIDQIQSLRIDNNDALQNLVGLEGVTECREFLLRDNEQMVDVSGFQQVAFTDLSFIDKFVVTNNPSLISLSGLTTGSAELKEVLIANNPLLENLDGLEGVSSVRYKLEVKENDALEHLDGLVNVSSFGRDLIIKNNPSLLHVDGLINCVFLRRSLIIQDNEALQNLNGLANIQNEILFTAQYLFDANPQLSDISGLANFNFTSLNAESELSFQGNTSLSSCAVESVCDFLASDSLAEITIMNNAPGCNSEPEVILECDLDINIISGEVRFDFNNDGCDITDLVAPNILIETTDGTNTYGAFTNAEGFYQNFVEADGSVTTSVAGGSLPPFYMATPATTTTVFSGFGNEEIVDFCLTASEDIDDVKITIVPITVARAGFNARYQLIYENLGTTIANGQVSLQFDTSRQNFVNATPNPTTVSGGLIEWDYATLQPFEIRTIDVTLFTQAPPVNQPDDELLLIAHVDPITNDVDIENNDATLKQLIVASYDPNDKQIVQGAEISEDEVGGYLDYIVRFQNTGNAEALQVIVTDTLHSNLDWGTVRPLSASHQYTTQIFNGNAVSFTFNDINLPPEVSDPVGSQGYVAFQVRTKNDLLVGDVIENTANIFFDANPPIITNTTATTVIDTTPPTAVCQTVLAVLDENGEVIVTADEVDGGSTDANGISDLEISQTDFNCSHVGENDIILTVTDTSGNQSTCTANVFVFDHTPPIFDSDTLPLDQVRQAESNGFYMLEDFTENLLVSDNCTDDLEVVQSPEIGSSLEPGVHFITLSSIDTATNDATYVFQLTVEEFLSATDFTLKNAITIYPNPASEKLFIVTSEGVSVENIRIYSVVGIQVKTTSEATLDISNFSEGIYFVKIKTNRGNITKKIVIE